jgi:alpha-amylase/alpha-mannosidase (GH57 family)
MKSKTKYICIHGHYYQPPRENAWLEVVEAQDSAHPFHDWNERIADECYAPNAAARILDDKSLIRRIFNNYARISFNFGPTLLSWMQLANPDAYRLLQDGDRRSQQRYDGHGSAIAQVYNHIILPLANPKDQLTQVLWGIRDFEARFGRKPEGMWLAETAADTASLEVLAAEGIQYTILAPRQAKAFRKTGTSAWTPTNSIDTRRPYRCNLPSGKYIDLFFYNGDVAQDVAFNGLLNTGKGFAQRLLQAFDNDDEPQLVHIATDGESYGHHHRYGEMALADCLNTLEENGMAVLTNYGQYLALFPPTHEAIIHENSSWSCVHGVERWRANCGCNSGRPVWQQHWRAPLRAALDWLRDQLIPIYEREAALLVNDPWAVRNAYIDVILDRSEENITTFVKTHAKRDLLKGEQTQLLRLLEMQRNTMLMYTSCGWFFDEISGLETNQILQYACRAIDYAIQTGHVDLHEQFCKRLELAPSNVFENGAVSYRKHVLSSRVDLERVGMHYAVASLFEKKPQQLDLFNYEANSEVFERLKAGNQRIAIGRTVVKSCITLSEKHFSFAVLYLGQHNIIGNISTDMDLKTFDKMKEQILPAFKSTNLGEVIGIMQTFFGSEKYSISSLFYDEKRKILNQIAGKSMQHAETAFREVYNDNYQLMSGMANENLPIPEGYLGAVKHILNYDIQHYFEQEILSEKDLQHLVNEFEKWKISIRDTAAVGLSASGRIYQEILKVEQSDSSLEQIHLLNTILEMLQRLGIKLDIWKSQNVFYKMLKSYKNGEWVFVSDAWMTEFSRLGELLGVKVELMVVAK